MKYVYPAIFESENGKYYVSVPDLSGCNTTGESLQDAIEMARDAIGATGISIKILRLKQCGRRFLTMLQETMMVLLLL